MAPGFLPRGAVDDVVLELRVEGGDVLLGEVDELQGEAPVSGVVGRGFRTKGPQLARRGPDVHPIWQH